MSEQIDYRNVFEYELIPKTGVLDVISDDRMPTSNCARSGIRRTKKNG